MQDNLNFGASHFAQMALDPDAKRKSLDLSPTGRARVVVVSTVVTALCVLLSVGLTAFGIVPIEPSRMAQQYAVNLVVPVVIAFPVMYFLMSKLRELAVAHRQLTIYASTDGLTKLLNRAAFSTLVDAYLREVQQARGALLIVDADDFKSINDRYGHDRGDEALVAIAQAMRSMLRAPEIIGRLGGEEFGVFLPGASRAHAETVAERIRVAVRHTEFAPTGTPHALSVSVGGAVFTRPLSFSDLFRSADGQLYAAKRAGRDRTAVTTVDGAALAA